MGEDRIKVERGLARGARARFIRMVDSDAFIESQSRDNLMSAMNKIPKNKLSANDLTKLIDKFEYDSRFKSTIRTSRIKHSVTSAATSFLRFYLRKEPISMIENKKNDDSILLLSDEDFKDSENQSLLVLSLIKLFMSRSQFELSYIPLFINFNNHFIERWCLRTNNIDASPIISDLSMNFGFIEYLRNTISMNSPIMPVAIPFKDGLALGTCVWIYTSSSPDGSGGMSKLSLSFRPGERVKTEHLDNPLSHEYIFGLQKHEGSPTVCLRTFISFSEMRREQIMIYEKLVSLRNTISKPNLDIYDVLIAKPPDNVNRRVPVPGFDNLSKIFKDAIIEVSDLSQELVSSGLWDNAIKNPKGDSFLKRM